MKILPIILLILLTVQATCKARGDSSHNYFQGEVLRLNRNWNLVLDKYLNYAEVLQDTTAIKIAVPGIWNDVTWKGHPFTGKGFGTYYTTINLDRLSQNKQLSLEMPYIGLAYRLYINDQLIGEIGKAGSSRETSIPKLTPWTFDIPQGAYQDKITVIVQIANFWHQNGGIWFTPTLGDKTILNQQQSRRTSLILLVLGCILFAGIYHLYLYLNRGSEKYGLYFFLISICLLVQSATVGSMPVINLFPDVAWQVIKKINYLSIFTVGALNALFIQSLFPSVISKLFVKYLTIVSLLASIVSLVLPVEIVHYFIRPFYLIIIITGIYLIYVLIKAARLNLLGSRLLTLGITIAFLATVNDILVASYLIDSIRLVHFGMFIYVITLSFVAARRFTEALSSEEKFSRRLENINQELEDRVKLRTAQLEYQTGLVAKKNEILKGINGDQKQLMAVVAHDLKAPLNKILGLSNLMEQEAGATKTNSIIKKVALEGRKLIDNLTNLSSYESDDFRIYTEKVDFVDFVKQRVREFNNEARAKNITIDTNLTTTNIPIQTDKELLGRIIDNILSNALKFSPIGCTVFVDLQCKESCYKLSIRDQGPGFTDIDKRKVFGKFQKLSAQPTAGENSTGLGLSIVKTLTKKLNGTILMSSEPGQGATFMLTLPTHHSSLP